MAVDYEYTTIDVDILMHPKAIAAGLEAMGLWLWAMAWSHKTGANGKVPRHVVGLAWGGPPKLVEKLAKRLVASGLWIATDDGWTIWNYGKKNQSAEEKERRRALGRERMQRLRGKKRDAVGDDDCDASLLRHVRDEDAAPDLICDLKSRSEEPDPARATSANDVAPTSEAKLVRPFAQVPDPGGPPPPWWSDALRTVAETPGGATLPNGMAWIRYAGHRAGKRLPATREDALYWLGTVMVPEEHEKRRKETHQRERDAKYDAARDRSRGVPGEAVRVDPKQAQRDAEAFAKRIADRKAREGKGAA